MSTANRAVVTSLGVGQTRALGRRLAKLLRAGDVVLLQGALGAGKTALAQGVGQGLKVQSAVNSPTFVLMARHDPVEDGRGLALFHADLYRLTEPWQVEELELPAQAVDGVLLIEWPDRGLGVLPAEHLLVAIESPSANAKERRITIVANGERYRRILDGLGARG